ncbi:MAG: hypothetical protein FJ098_13675 [Deltaproteobacteria bacterium]|nr:hypothetical protein [Deltaproteobacteria bacterium]
MNVRFGIVGLLPVLSLVFPSCGGGELEVCAEGARRCQGAFHVERCVEGGFAWVYLESCPAYATCVDGACVADCTPACDGRACGDDGCGGSCGTCEDGWYCWEGSCRYGLCEPDCAGRACGDDGCGGSCGTCQWPEACGDAGVCTCPGWCPPPREGVTACGPDGCGGSCGTCAEGELCSGARCVTAEACPEGTWACGEASCCEGDETCRPVGGAGPYCCAPVEHAACLLHEDGTWEVAWFDTCGEPWQTVESCPGGCTEGHCEAACTPACTGKACGDDGCGGSCGTCPAGSGCQGGKCVPGVECTCSSGPCCTDGCSFDGTDTPCGEEEVVACLGACGGAVVLKARHRYCDGHEAGCTGAWDPFKAVETLDDCADAERCQEGPPPACVPAAELCLGAGEDCDAVAQDAWEPNETQDKAAFAVEGDGFVNPCAPALALEATLDAAGDVDWYTFQTEDKPCPFSPVIGLPGFAGGAVLVRCWSGGGHVLFDAGPSCQTLPAGDGMGYGALCEATGPEVAFTNLRCGEEDWGAADNALRIWVRVGDAAGETCGAYLLTVQ